MYGAPPLNQLLCYGALEVVVILLLLLLLLFLLLKGQKSKVMRVNMFSFCILLGLWWELSIGVYQLQWSNETVFLVRI